MLYCEPFFLFFFLPLTLGVYFVSPQSWRNFVLVAASLLFYAVGEDHFFFWLVGSVLLNYWLAIMIAKNAGRPAARTYLIIGLVSDLALLFVFKYTTFAVENLNGLLAWAQAPTLRVPHIPLALGISFFTFHKISYKVDVYRGTAPARRNLVELALYILLFPQLIAGPIVRYQEIATELHTRFTTRNDLAAGICRFICGLGKKMILANAMGHCTDSILALPSEQVGTGLAWLAVVCYTGQIYFDFSGYSDMAIGLARLFGFHFPENFNYPYVARSITDFWHRWHMSLSRWFRDYLYIPLGGNRVAPWRVYFNLFLVFFLCGLWHGANWHFAVWGMFHGLLLVAEKRGLGKALLRMPVAVQHGYTMFLVMIGWVLFRADTLEQATDLLLKMAGLKVASAATVGLREFLNGELAVILMVGAVAATPIIHWVRAGLEQLTDRLSSVEARRALDFSRGSLATASLLVILVYSSMLIASGTYNPFIYYRF